MKIFVCGSCQVDSLLVALKALLPSTCEVTGGRYTEQWLTPGPQNLIEVSRSADVFLTNLNPIRFAPQVSGDRITEIPDLLFYGFHLDLIMLRGRRKGEEVYSRAVKFQLDGGVQGKMWFSALALWAFTRQRTLEQTVALFHEDTFRALGYFDVFQASVEVLAARFLELGFDFMPFREVLHGRELFMWGPEHPKLFLVFRLAESIAKKLGLKISLPARGTDRLFADPLAAEYAFGCHPPIADYLGVDGTWASRIGRMYHQNLKTYVWHNFRAFKGFEKGSIATIGGVIDLAKIDVVMAGNGRD